VVTARRGRHGRVIGIALVSGLLAAGCAIPTQKNPSTVSPNRVPPGLVSPALPTSTTQPKQSSQVQVKVYLLGAEQQLQPVNRVVEVPAPLNSIITSMVAGPTQSEIRQGIRTAIPADVEVLFAHASGSIVTVNFNDTFGEITGADTELAVAQVVATVAAENGPNVGLIFEIDGVPISVPIASGAQVPGPVYLLQFLTAPS
jgi:Sporulation and spore germination